jgi:hypothetical protein
MKGVRRYEKCSVSISPLLRLIHFRFLRGGQSRLHPSFIALNDWKHERLKSSRSDRGHTFSFASLLPSRSNLNQSPELFATGVAEADAILEGVIVQPYS